MNMTLVIALMCALAAAQNTLRQSIPGIARDATGAVVSIVMSDKAGHPISKGSGFLISTDGRVVTNYHVIKSGTSAVVKLPNGAFFVVDGVLAFDKDHDVAIIKAHGNDFHTVRLGDSDHLQVGQQVVAIGNPLSLESTVSNGILSGIRVVEEGGGKVLQITAPISPGSSGGPLFDMTGEVIGITAAYLRGGENLNFAIPINEAKQLLRTKLLKAQSFPDEPEAPSAQTSNDATRAPICAFVTAGMSGTLPQVPTFCEQKSPSEAAVYSPTNVLEGSMRRAWSTALFQTLQDAGMSGPCSEHACVISISDSAMSQGLVHYEALVDKDHVGLMQTAGATLGGKGSASDQWYIMWWASLDVVSDSPWPPSAENAASLAGNACEAYTRAAGPLNPVGNLHTIGGDWPSPQCSVLLATKDRVDIVLDFQNSFQAAMADYAALLITSFGKSFEFPRYEGDVIIRTSWDRGFRRYEMYSLRMLCFLWGEIQSGTRTEPQAFILLSTMGGVRGQTDQLVFSSTQKEGELIVRNGAVVRIVPATGRTIAESAPPSDGFLADLTDGSEWLVSRDALDRCKLEVGREATILASGSTAPRLSASTGGHACNLNASFVKGW